MSAYIRIRFQFADTTRISSFARCQILIRRAYFDFKDMVVSIASISAMGKRLDYKAYDSKTPRLCVVDAISRYTEKFHIHKDSYIGTFYGISIYVLEVFV